MRIYKYDIRERPIPKCVISGGHVYDGNYSCIGFGVEKNERYEITPEEFEEHYNKVFEEHLLRNDSLEEGEERTLTAVEFLEVHGASKRDQIIDELKESDLDLIRCIEDVIYSLKKRGFLKDEDLHEKTIKRIESRKDLRKKL